MLPPFPNHIDSKPNLRGLSSPQRHPRFFAQGILVAGRQPLDPLDSISPAEWDKIVERPTGE
jgi:hypothetical protein